MLTIKPTGIHGYQLLHEGMLVLSEMERNGLHVDIDYCKKQEAHLARRISHLQKKFEHSDLAKKWKSVYKGNFKMSSNQQLADILFNHLGYEPKILTAKNAPSTKEAALEQVDNPDLADIMLHRKLSKLLSTYLRGYIREQVDGYIHPIYNLHLIVTYRSSCDHPNIQNAPARIPMSKKLIRKAIIPRPGRVLVEIDYSGVEVRVATCYHRDPNMVQEILDPTRDMHRDMAMECFLLEDEDWIKNDMAKLLRYCGKNKFVFPQFYGDYYIPCARALWDAIHLMGLTTPTGIPMMEHLKSKGIRNYKKFENHLKSVEECFWGERFPVYAKWREDIVKWYHKHGYVDTFTGFRLRGIMSKNDVTNYPVQGAAFHCLLWSLVQMNQWLKREKLDSLLVGEIHDSMILDCVVDEIPAIIGAAQTIMCEKIVAEWPWITVPLEIETEMTPIDGSWDTKREVHENFCGECGFDYRWKKPVENGTMWECPVCRATEIK